MNEKVLKAEAVRYWWDKAHESLRAARRELAARAYTFAINRAYYALFYAVSALLLEEGRRFTKHSGVRAAFNEEIVKPGRLSRGHGDLHNQLFRDRQEGDYVGLPGLILSMYEKRLMHARRFSRIFAVCSPLCHRL